MLFCFAFPCYSAEKPKVGETVYHISFSGADSLNGFSGSGKLASDAEKKVLFFDIPSTEKTGKSVSMISKLPIEKLRGTRIRVAARIKAENVEKPPQAWNGVKCMIHSKSATGDQWQQKDGVIGTFDWTIVEFNALIDQETTDAELVLGIENSSGKAWFDEITITTIGVQRMRPAVPKGVFGSVYRGHSQPRLRGVMIQPKTFEEEDLNVLARWGVNHVRWQFLWDGFPNGPADTATVEEYNDWIEKECQKLDRILPMCKDRGVFVVVDVHTPPGGRLKNSDMRMFKEKEFQTAFLDVWEKLAKRYKGNEAVWGYDLLNEPVEGTIPPNSGILDWRELAVEAIERIRAIDSDRAIIVETAPWGGPEGFDWFEPIDAKNIVYSAHLYLPHKFTHQGVHDTASIGLKYPGEVDGKFWNKEQLRKALKPVIDFQNDYGVHFYLGEFSAIRWAPPGTGRQYLSDCVDLFEEYGWDWAYHAFREWNGWSLEHSGDRADNKPTTEPTDRLLLMQSWFEMNRKK